MAYDSWDEVQQAPIFNDDVYNGQDGSWRARSGTGSSTKPSVQRAKLLFEDHFSVEEDITTSLVTVAVKHQSPQIAFRWLELIIAKINEDVRARDIWEAEQSIKFLNLQRANNDIPAINNVFCQLIEEQIKTKMLAQASEEYILILSKHPIYQSKELHRGEQFFVSSGCVSVLCSPFYILLKEYGRKVLEFER